MPIEQVLIRADQKGAGTARRIDNVSGRVIDAARFLNLRFVFDFGAMAFGKSNDFAQKLFVNLPENICGQDGKFVRTFWIVEPPDDFLENGIVDLEPRREIVRRFDAIFFFWKWN